MIIRRHIVVFACALLLAACGKEDATKSLGSAKEALAKRDYKTAVIHLKNVLKGNADSPEGRYLLGKALLENGELDAAVVELTRARDLKHSSDEVTPALLQAYLLQRQFDKLIEEAKRAPVLGRKPKGEVSTMLAAAHLAKGDRAGAEKAINEALVADPDSIVAMNAKARLKLLDNDVPAALAMVQLVAAKAPGDVDAQKLMGDIYSTQGKRAEALTAYRKALELRPDFALARLAVVYSLLGQAKYDPKSKDFTAAVEELKLVEKAAPQSYATWSALAQVAYASRDFKSAREYTQKMLRAAPDAMDALRLSGAVEYNLGALAQAQQSLEKVLKADPKSTFARYWLTMVFLGRGQPAKALEVLAPVLGEAQTGADLTFLAGQVYLQAGDFKKAEEYLKKANTMDPANPGTRTALALSRLRRGDGESAFTDLEQISASDSGTVADWALISTRMATGNLDRALKGVEALDKKQPNSALVTDLRGVILLKKNDVAGARAAFEAALRINPAFLASASRLAVLDMGDKKPEAAVKRYEGVIAADAGNTGALLALARLKSDIGAPKEEVIALINKAIAAHGTDAVSRVALVDYYLKVMDAKGATAAAVQAAAAIPDNVEVLNALGYAQFAGGETNQAVKTYSKITELRPELVEPYLMMSKVLAAAKSYDAAAQALRRGLATNKNARVLQQSLVTIEVARGKFDDAVTVAREVQKGAPKSNIGFELEGDVLVARGKMPEAVAMYRNSLKVEKSPELAIKLFSVLAEANQRAEAMKLEAEWLKENPKDPVFRNFAAEAAIGLRQFEKAKDLLLQVNELRPDNPSVLNNLAIVTNLLGQPGAIEYAEKANKIAPDRSAFMDTLGMLLLEKGDTARALDLVSKASAGAPLSAEIRLNYVRVLAKAGKKAEAKAILTELSKLGDKFKGQDEVKKLLAEVS
jgi:cellulose synthase operon protein C